MRLILFQKLNRTCILLSFDDIIIITITITIYAARAKKIMNSAATPQQASPEHRSVTRRTAGVSQSQRMYSKMKTFTKNSYRIIVIFCSRITKYITVISNTV